MELGFTVPASVTHLQAARVNVPFTPISRPPPTDGQLGMSAPWLVS
jgi:hypothetical protein